ncbi:MAG: ATP-binding cassette domain-containing protein, partial [Spirochaetia bacterium]
GHDRKLRIMLDSAATCGIGYLTARQPGRTLSGGERQRLRIASVLSKRKNRETLFILDEPTVGLHRENARELAAVLDGLAENGNSVIVIEHSMEFLARCDWLIELGPEGGPDGGRIIFQGTPRELAAAETPSSFFMREVLG